MSTALGGARGRVRRLTAPMALALGVLVASVVLHVRDPHQSGSYLFCPWLLLTGTFCPGCGGLRAVHDLTRGDLTAAASSNLLLVGALPLAVGLWVRWLADRWRGLPGVSGSRAGPGLALALGLAALVFWVTRNLPGLEWLAP